MKSLLIQIEKSLEATIHLILGISKKNGYTDEFPIDKYTIKYWEPDKDRPNGYTLKTKEWEDPSFDKIYNKIRNEVENSSHYKDLDTKCNLFKSKHAKYMEKFSGGDYGRIFIKEYFTKLSKLVFKDDIIRDVVSTFKNDLISNKIRISLLYYIEDFDAQSPINLNDQIVIRPICDSDLNTFAVFDQFTFMETHYLRSNGWICEISLMGDKDSYEYYNNTNEIIHQIMNALFFIKPGKSKFRLLRKRVDNPFLSWGVMGSTRVVNSGIGDKIFLSEEDIILFKSFYESVQLIYDVPKYKQLRLALRRVKYAVNRSDDTDKILDFVIALESLIASDSPALETTYRFRLRIASLIDHQYGNSRERIKIAGELYDVRSLIVHGQEDPDKVNKYVPIAEDILRQIIVWFIENMLKIEPNKMIPHIDDWMVRDNVQV